jgi:glycosyltransferase involved in cell wall biosynthesis
LDAHSQKPRILLVGGDGRPSGVPRHILHLVSVLQEEAELTVISDEDEGGYTALRQMNVRHRVISGLTNRPSLRHHWHGISALLRTLKSEPSDMIWIHARLQVLICRLLLALRIWKPSCPVVFTHHGLPYGRGYHLLVHRICKSLEKMLVATCPPQDLVFLNHRMAGWMARDARAVRLARHRVHILPNCSNLRPLPRKNDMKIKRLVMTGRTGRQKDYDVAVRLLAELPAHFRLTLCGPGTDDANFQTNIAMLISQDVFHRITFTGPLPDARQPISTADAYLLTSRYEGTPIGALEAFEAGLPIILRDFDGATDLVSKHPCGLLMGSNDLAYEAKRITALLETIDGDAEALRAEIREVWRANWAPAIFARNARALVRSVLRSANGPVAAPDYIRDAPKPHQDLRKNVAARVPAPPPYYTASAPSVESGLQQ